MRKKVTKKCKHVRKSASSKKKAGRNDMVTKPDFRAIEKLQKKCVLAMADGETDPFCDPEVAEFVLTELERTEKKAKKMLAQKRKK